MELDVHAIGERIKNRRKELGLTQLDIRAVTGISSGNISDIENGNRLPAAPTLVQLSGVLHCSIDWMLTGPASMPDNAESPIADNAAFSVIGDSEAQTLLRGFRRLPRQDQEELLEILRLKLRRAKKGNGARSSHLTNPTDTDQAG